MSATVEDADALRARADAGDADAGYALGRWHAGRGELTRARRVWRRAAESGSAAAVNELALHALFGVERDVDIETAAAGFVRAAAAGYDEAAYRVAMLRLAGIALPSARDAGLEHLRMAARAEHAPAWLGLALIAEAHGDEASAAFAVAHAAAIGDPLARALSQPFAGDRDALAAAKVRALAATEGPAPAPTLEWQTLSADPALRCADDALGPLARRLLIASARPHLAPSVGFDSALGRIVASPLRSSDNMLVTPLRESYATLWIAARLTAAAGERLECAEPVDVLRYGPGAEYRPHRDYLPPSDRSTGPAPNPGQRTATLFVYLASPADGGATAFPDLPAEIAPVAGRLVHFRNVDARGAPDARTLHAGLPVISGEKWLATVFLRERVCRRF